MKYKNIKEIIKSNWDGYHVFSIWDEDFIWSFFSFKEYSIEKNKKIIGQNIEIFLKQSKIPNIKITVIGSKKLIKYIKVIGNWKDKKFMLDIFNGVYNVEMINYEINSYKEPLKSNIYKGVKMLEEQGKKEGKDTFYYMFGDYSITIKNGKIVKSSAANYSRVADLLMSNLHISNDNWYRESNYFFYQKSQCF